MKGQTGEMRTYVLPSAVVPEGFIPPDASLPWRPLASDGLGYPSVEARQLLVGDVLIGCSGGETPVLSRSVDPYPTIRVEVEWGMLIFHSTEKVHVRERP